VRERWERIRIAAGGAVMGAMVLYQTTAWAAGPITIGPMVVIQDPCKTCSAIGAWFCWLYGC
jgi:hypothetical protein